MTLKALLLVSFLLTILPNSCDCEDAFIIGNSTRFTFDVYRSVFDVSENLIMSPISLRIMLGLIHQSLTNEEALNFQKKLGFPAKHLAMIDDLRSLAEYSGIGSNLKFLNKLFVTSQKGPIRTNFQFASNAYNSQIELVDFRFKCKTAQVIDRWTYKNLGKHFYASNSSTDYDLLIMNSVNFTGFWKEEFNVAYTTYDDFRLYDDTIQNVEMMSRDGEFRVAKMTEEKFQVLELPYQNNSYFWIILPDFNTSSITIVKDQLTHELIRKIDETFKEISIEITIPKFSVESEIDGKTILTRLGVGDLFEKRYIDLFQNNSPIKLNQFIYKHRIAVTETGTEADGNNLGDGSVIPENEFIANRPFIYMVMHASLGIKDPIFIGHYSNPLMIIK